MTSAAPLSSVKQDAHTLLSVVRNIATTRGIHVETHGSEWVMSLHKDSAVRYIWGYTFSLNSASAAKICGDKAATSCILKAHKVPHICHHLFVSPHIPGEWLYPKEGIWPAIHTYAKKQSYNVVCKPVDGTGGIDVFHVERARDLETEVGELFHTKHNVVICAYKAIKTEYRVILLKNKVELIFAKVPPFVVGDGNKTVALLIHEYLSALPPLKARKIAREIPPALLTSSAIPNPGQEVRLCWKHNLGQGATAQLIDGIAYREATRDEKPQSPLVSKLIELATKTAQVLDLAFGSVDIVELENEPNPLKQLRVMEVNQGVMMDNLMAQHGAQGVAIAEQIYGKAIDAMFSTIPC